MIGHISACFQVTQVNADQLSNNVNVSLFVFQHLDQQQVMETLKVGGNKQQGLCQCGGGLVKHLFAVCGPESWSC